MRILQTFENFLVEFISNKVSNNLSLLNVKKDKLDFIILKNRRFMYNPNTGELILGDTNVLKGSSIKSSHSEEYYDSGAIGYFDDFTRGWVSGKAKGYTNGVIHFAPPIHTDSIEEFNKGYSTLKMFKKFGANKNTIIRNFGHGEEKLGNILTFENVQDDIGFGVGATFSNDAGEQFWGNLAAGVLPICPKTKRILLAFRSKWVNEPNTWGIFGGKLDEDVQEEGDLTQVALREFQEESGYDGDVELIPVYVFKKPNFEYHNFLGIVDEEFIPQLDWETEDTRWVNLEEFMQIYPKHFGLKDLIKNDLEKIKSYVS